MFPTTATPRVVGCHVVLRGMAFIGDGDGTPDVHNIDDASLTAAVYLCETGNDLTQPDNWIKAVAAYNAGSDYNTRIVEAANTYSAADQ